MNVKNEIIDCSADNWQKLWPGSAGCVVVACSNTSRLLWDCPREQVHGCSHVRRSNRLQQYFAFV